ncbi:hypothetical protein ACET7V_00355 [Aeromonas sanarellii]|uniref:hypothetical protein n=1 Tax=Aeromonas sanarellii TaxID=633415 RepID=UPI0038D08663
MFAKRYRPDELIEIIAAQSYSPEIVAYVKKVEHQPTLAHYLKSKPKLGVTGTIAKDYVEATTPNAVPYISTKQVKGLHAYIEDAKYISKEADIEWKKCRVDDGDIVINKSGDVGAAAVLCCAPYKYANSVSDIISIKLSETAPIDRDFLVVYLNSPFGQKQLQRLSGGAIFSHVSLHAIPHINVYTADVLAQKYIGDKVRQAERLRAWAASAQEETVREMPAYKPMISHYAESSYRVSPDILLSARLDSSFFHPDHRALDSKMKESGCQYFGKMAFAVKPGWNKKSSDSFLYYEIGGLNVSNGTIVPVETLTSEAPSRATTAVKHGDVLVSTVRPNRKNVGFVIEDEQDIPMVATSGFSVIRFESLVDAAFYHAWLRTDDATSQLMRWNSGSAYPAIDEDVPLQIFVPEFDASLRERLGQTLLDTHFALLHSAKLTNAAKLLVEDLIEGQITEAQLIAAEQALQVGNDTLDRKILSRLKTDGIDGDGAALFSDLDELYRLLALAEVE